MSELWQNHISYWRKRAGVSQEALAHSLEEATTKGTISQYESGKRKPSVDRLIEIAAVLGCKPGELMDGPNEGFIPPNAEEIQHMIALAMRELPVGATNEDYQRVVASSLHAQLEQLRAVGGFRRTEGETTAPGKAAQSPAPTKRGGQAGSRNP